MDLLLNTGLTPCIDTDTTHCLRWLCNLAFSDVLEPVKNNKFPGGMVVSLSRSDLVHLKGTRPFHVPYKSTEIYPWLSPTKRTIPPFRFSANVNRHFSGASMKRNNCHLDTDKLDFGTEDGLLYIVAPLPLKISGLNFGDDDGLIQVRV